jgi:hypothetical protein
MESNTLLAAIQALEVEIHQPDVRSDLSRLDQLLHPRFREFGRSGRIYTKAEMLAEFSQQLQTHEVWSQDFQLEPLTEGLALLTYKSAHINSAGTLERHANRASLWQLTGVGWQMLFHQGTPTAAFTSHTS